MRRFYFHVYNSSGLVRDEEGAELADLGSARIKGLDGIWSILSEEVRNGALDLRGRLEIVDDTGAIAAVIPFRDAIELHLDNGMP